MASSDSQSPDAHAPAQSSLISVAEKKLAAKCRPHTFTYCPTMDLVALATEDDQVHVFRLNGERVFGGSYGNLAADKGTAVVRALTWKENGRFLAVACSDNNIRLLSSYNGKTVHCLPCNGSSPSRQAASFSSSQQGYDTTTPASICCVSWGVTFTDGNAYLNELKDTNGRVPVDEILSPNTQLTKTALLKGDLPRELALLDIESSLPKLSCLPATGDEDDVFSSKTSIDAIFHANNRNWSDAVHILLAGLDDGSVHLRIFDCFDIGSFKVADASATGPDEDSFLMPLIQSSHPMSSTQAIIFERESDLQLVTIDLRFIAKSGRYLSLLASKVTQLQNLLRYMKQVQNQMHLEWKNAQELPGRYIGNINEDLQEHSLGDFVTAAYHLLVTGDCFEPLKEFLVDQVGERGHKRWDKAVASGYESLRRLTYESLLPVLERCGVILSRLLGLSKYHRISPILGLETKDLKVCQTTVDCLNLLAHKVLISTSTELREFGAFSKWLRYQIDLQATDPLSSAVEELLEKADAVDHQMTLSYIQGGMTHSALQDFIQAPSSETDGGRWVDAGENSLFYENYKKLLQQHNQRKSDEERVVFPQLSDLTSRLARQCDAVFKRIAETQRRGILHRTALTLGQDCDASILDMVMDYSDYEDETLASIYIATRSRRSSHILYIYRSLLSSVNGVSSTKANLMATLDFRAGTIKDVKFVEDGTLMLLWFSEVFGTWHLVNLPYVPAVGELPLVNYEDISSPPRAMTVDLNDLEGDGGFICHTFPEDEGVEPVTLEVNGRKGRRVVCVLYADGMRYSVFDMDSADGADADAEEENDEA